MYLSAKTEVLWLVIWLVISFVAAAFGVVATKCATTFYGQLEQPRWAPPSWIFGPVWTVLFALMGVSAWLVWSREGFAAHYIALSCFIIQLVLNALWGWVFFAWHRGRLSLVNIAFLWLFIVITLVLFWRVSSLAGILLIPYLGWVSFACLLNYSVVWRNPEVLS